jgi:hypothetical protein
MRSAHAEQGRRRSYKEWQFGVAGEESPGTGCSYFLTGLGEDGPWHMLHVFTRIDEFSRLVLDDVQFGSTRPPPPPKKEKGALTYAARYLQLCL